MVHKELVKSGVDRYFLSVVSADNYKSLNDFYSSLGITVQSNTTTTTTNSNVNNGIDTNSIEYKINTKYGERGADIIKGISNKYNLDQTEVYNIFVNNNVTQEQMGDIHSSIMGNMENDGIFNIYWGSSYTNVGNALIEIKSLVENVATSLAA